MLGPIFKQIHIAFESRCNKNLQRYNLTQSQMDVLVYLKHHGSSTVTQRDLEAGLRLTNPTITGILNRLEDKNLITRETNLNDRRSKIIKMTDKSKIVLEESYIDLKELESQIIKGFSDEEKEELVVLLNKVLNNLK
ncbi:MarR family winged helix-turn-helix transcriptional regulator [Intestinibacter sp.]|uniref:MarR family winged helix-turn-helix transcriptional regulator n=1 Tax=Intestinibacter sp. TaxID=1965304 RepID=UPI002A7607E7|nr:MarR family transcriptional regulator [Intestinibacter sp.]MDY2735766.1 MarR family transcriptional regulator [Intestinibacter sp.]MDY4574429.1 MarR family transcriptional regulator [Intestinibacter sp.]